MAPSTDEYGVALGMRTGREFWVVGRAGVLGDCTAEVAAAALGFHAPEHVHAAWEASAARSIVEQDREVGPRRTGFDTAK